MVFDVGTKKLNYESIIIAITIPHSSKQKEIGKRRSFISWICWWSAR